MADETCRTYQVDGEPVVVRGDRPLDEQSQQALAELVRAAKEHSARVNPHGGVIQELIAAVRLAVHCIPDGPIHAGVLGERDGADTKSRLKHAVAAARATLELTQQEVEAERASRQAWAEEAMRLDVQLAEPFVTELDMSQIPEHLRASDVQRVLRAAGLQPRLEVDAETTAVADGAGDKP